MPQKLETFFQGHQPDSDNTNLPPVKSFPAFIKKTLPSLPGKKKNVLSEVFQLEWEKRRMDEKINSHSLLSIKERIRAQQAETISKADNETFKKLTLRLDTDVCLSTTNWDWSDSNREHWLANLDREKGQEEEEFLPILLKPSPLGVNEIRLSPFIYTIFYEFQESNPVEGVMRSVIEAFESMAPEEEEMLKEKIIQQIKEALSAGILIEG